MTAKVELSIAAVADLQNLFDYGFDRFGEATALSYREGLLEHFATLAEFPEAYAEDKSLNPPGRVAPHNRHVVLYAFDGATVFIGRIRHHSEDWRKTPSGA